jgi:hypothetical protein
MKDIFGYKMANSRAITVLYENFRCIIKLKIVCRLHFLRSSYQNSFPLPGLLSFLFDDADHTFIDAFTAAGLITGRVGTLFGTEVFPEGIRAGIIIGPKPRVLSGRRRGEQTLLSRARTGYTRTHPSGAKSSRSASSREALHAA